MGLGDLRRKFLLYILIKSLLNPLLERILKIKRSLPYFLEKEVLSVNIILIPNSPFLSIQESHKTWTKLK